MKATDRLPATAAGPRVCAALLLFAAAALGQKEPTSKERDEEIAKLAPVDPYTGNDAALMAAAGIVAYGSFPWADSFRTEDVDKVLGQRRLLWLETTHFRIGCSLVSAAIPEDPPEYKKVLLAEVKQLRQKLPRVPEKPKRLDPWLRLHLYAQRCENAYTECLKLLGATDADFALGDTPRYLGMPDKFLVLLFQKRSDMARYMERYFASKETVSMRQYHQGTNQVLACISAEGLEGFDESGIHQHVTQAVWNNLIGGVDGFRPLPLWFGEGIAHWYERKVPAKTINVLIKDDEAVAEEKRDDWPVKVRRRAQHDGGFLTFDKMAAWVKWEELGYHAHAQSWSRIDYLMSVDPQKVGKMLRALKTVPQAATAEESAPLLRERAAEQLQELFGLDAAGFDQKWRAWVLKTYPKK